MFGLIPSEYVRNFYKERGITFSDRERAMLICNLRDDLPLQVIWEELGKIAAATNDEELKADIKELIDLDHKQIELLRNNDSKDCVYIIRGISGYENAGIFLDYENALEYGLSIYKKFNVDRELLVPNGDFYIQKCTLGGVETSGNIRGLQKGKARFNNNGEMLYVSGQGEILRKEEKTPRSIPLETPFERGDIVMDCVTREIGVVETNRINSFDICTNYIEVVFILNTPISDRPISPIILEKVENFDIKGKSAELIRNMSDILRGTGHFRELFLTYNSIVYNMGDRRVFAKKEQS